MHAESVWRFYKPDSGTFGLSAQTNNPKRLEDIDDEPDPEPVVDPRQVKGLTTTFTCFESLLDGHYGDRQNAVEGDTRVKVAAFATTALARPEDWQSEGAAKTYCRVRALAPLFRHCHDLDEAQRASAVALLKEAWSPVRARPGRDGIIEVGQRKFDGNLEGGYPPNAYLSYWAMESLIYAPFEARAELEDKRRIVELWLEKWLGFQTALHYSESSKSDTQQIAWAISGLMIAREAPPDERKQLPVDELIRAGLKAFFEAQQSDGLWPRGDPLFHYPQAGNAYSYVFEALAVLVSLALGVNEASLSFRRQLEPYVAHLAVAFEAAKHGQRVLVPGAADVGWCSGHHPFRTQPESWATASVFRFLQALRKLVGLLSNESSAKVLGARVAREDLATLADRGRTWHADYGSAGVQLASMFVHPYLAEPRASLTDPDLPIFKDGQARSGLLFGPPGTSKTVSVEAVAGALGWPFVEISPAAFLNRGMDLVSARADEVFNHLMELHQAVVLLDEIDELIRSRTDDSDPVERFFTTTMLPRLAKLWKRRSILFFVNTNSIVHVDPAVMRSQRFDTALFVLPPGFRKKHGMLEEKGLHLDWTAEQINGIVRNPASVGEDLEGLGWLPLIRWDQMGRLESALKEVADANGNVPGASAAAVLHRFGRELVQTDWPLNIPKDGNAPQVLAPEDQETVQSKNERLRNVLLRYRELASYQRRDHDKQRVMAVRGQLALPGDAQQLPQGAWLVKAPNDDLYEWVKDRGFWANAAAEIFEAPPAEY